MTLQLTTQLRNKYCSLWRTAEIKYPSVIQNICSKIKANKQLYIQVSEQTDTPWEVIGAIHSLESSLNFNTHLHNGDSLRRRTTHVPSGRPRRGTPPFTWEESAIDALRLKPWYDWGIPDTLFYLEMYNGFGYYYRGVNSPYLWSYTNQYTKGKYVRDGVFDPNKVSRQVGAVPILKELGYAGVNMQMGPELIPLVFWGKEFPQRNADLQKFLNTMPIGADLLVDGWIGRKTSDAFFRVFGRYIEGDPRNI